MVRNKCLLFVELTLATLVISSVSTDAAAYLEGSTVKCYNEGEDVAIPFMRDACYRCKCLSTEIVCINTCGHKKCHFNGKAYKHNESWNNGTCTKCACNNGEVSCKQITCKSNIKCPPRETLVTSAGQCCPSCRSLSSQCTLKGSPLIGGHADDVTSPSPRTITTFDGLTYKFNGKCNYVLTRDCDERTFTIHLVQDPVDSSVPSARQSKVSRDISSSSSSSSVSSSLVSSSRLKGTFTAPQTPRDSLNTSPSLVSQRSRNVKEFVTHLSPTSLSSPSSSPVSLVRFNSTALTVQTPVMPKDGRKREASNAFRRTIRQTASGLHSSHSSVQSPQSLDSLSNDSSQLLDIPASQSPGQRASISLVIKMQGTKVRLTPMSGPEGWKIRHGRSETSLPFIEPGVMTIVKEAVSSSAKKSGARGNILVYTTRGIKVTWNGEDNLDIVMPSKMKSTLCGLCGNYNDSKRDDLRPRKGRSRSISRFINSWKVGTNGFCPTRTIKRNVPERPKVFRLPLLDT